MMRMILGSGRKYVDSQKTLETYVEWIQRATREVEDLMEKHGVADWVTTQRYRLWHWAGRVARATDGRWCHEVLHWDLFESRTRGRPPIRWEDQLTTFLRHKVGREIEPKGWKRLARDKIAWDKWTNDFCKFSTLSPP